MGIWKYKLSLALLDSVAQNIFRIPDFLCSENPVKLEKLANDLTVLPQCLIPYVAESDKTQVKTGRVYGRWLNEMPSAKCTNTHTDTYPV